jgi:hypothetical protein
VLLHARSTKTNQDMNRKVNMHKSHKTVPRMQSKSYILLLHNPHSETPGMTHTISYHHNLHIWVKDILSKSQPCCNRYKIPYYNLRINRPRGNPNMKSYCIWSMCKQRSIRHNDTVKKNWNGKCVNGLKVDQKKRIALLTFWHRGQ